MPRFDQSWFVNAVPQGSVNHDTGEIKGGAGDFGRITATSNNPRLVQAIRFYEKMHARRA